jgi:acyl-CoA reductase-like NAD-dependent aldehyde dehydrogenase
MAGSTALSSGRDVLPTLVEATKRIKVGPTDRDPQPDMGAVSRRHCDRVLPLIGLSEGGAKILRTAREKVSGGNGFLSADDSRQVQPGMTVARRVLVRC